MAMKYQKGTVYLRGQKVKMWYGKFLMYGKDEEGKEVRRHRNVAICPKADTPKWKAEQMLREIILKETKGGGTKAALLPDNSLTFRWFNSGTSGHLPGDAADLGNRHAETWIAEGYTRHSSARQHSHDRRHLCAADRRECAAGGELPHGCGARRMERIG